MMIAFVPRSIRGLRQGRASWRRSALRQTKALATVANAGDDVIMEVDADLF
jgi:hypothetical protein